MTRRFRTAGKGDMGHFRMGGERRAAGCAEAGDDIDHTGGKTGLMHQPGKFQKRCRPIFRGLDDKGAAGRECRADLDGGEKQLAVPRHDGRHDAHGFAPQPDIHIRLVDRQIGALDLVGQTRIITIIIRDIGNLRGGLTDDLAGIAGFEFGERLRILSDQIGEPVEQLATLCRRQFRPACIFVKRPMRGLDRTADIRLAAFRHFGPCSAACGIETCETPLTIFETSVDIALETAHRVTPRKPA